ncbi:MAG: exonuclease SbcCD subunit D [Anaerolineae bacterium]
MPPINVLHLADIHIGMENYGRLDPTSGLNSRVVDFLRRMTEAIDYALAHEVDVCIFAGDAYKNQRPNPTLQREFARRIKTLADAGVPTLLLAGNHDLSTADRAASSVDIFGTLDVPHVIVANREKLHRITCRRGQALQVAAAPYPQRNRLLSRDEYRAMSMEELDRALVELVSQNIAALAKEARQTPTLPTILTGHFSVGGAVLGSEQSVMLGRDVVVLKSVLADPTWDYVALGHIHKHQELNGGAQPPIVYPGSLERIDFGEEREPKGFVMVSLEKGNADWEFIQLKSRKFTTITVDVRRSDDPMPAILDKIDEYHLEGAVVRVIIQATEEQDPLIEDRLIQQALGRASYVAGIKHEVDRVFRRRIKTANIEELSPLKALSLYFDSKGVDAEKQKELLNHARQIIEGGN